MNTSSLHEAVVMALADLFRSLIVLEICALPLPSVKQCLKVLVVIICNKKSFASTIDNK